MTEVSNTSVPKFMDIEYWRVETMGYFALYQARFVFSNLGFTPEDPASQIWFLHVPTV